MTEEIIPATLVGAARERELDEAERGINRLIEFRSRTPTDKEEANREEEAWKESTRAYNAERLEARRHMWATHYRTLARNLRDSAQRFEDKANQLQEA